MKPSNKMLNIDENIIDIRHNEEVMSINANMLILISKCLALVFLCRSIVFCFIKVVPLGSVFANIFCFLFSYFSYFVCKKYIDKYKWAILPVAYIFVMGIVLYTFFISIYYNRSSYSVSTVAVLVMLPICIIDRPCRVNIVNAIVCVFFCLLTYYYKPLCVAQIEILNNITYCIIGNIVGKYIISVKLRNIALRESLQTERNIDILTGLPNRRLLFNRIEEYSKDPLHYKHFGIMMIDIDHFKKYNDFYGHQKGDACLDKLGCYLGKFAKENEIDIYRYGGEEFIGISTKHTYVQLGVIANMLCENTISLDIPTAVTPLGKVSVSIGYAEYNYCKAISCDQLISMADHALYRAKELGRNRVEGFM